jgi:hypothetical protein
MSEEAQRRPRFIPKAKGQQYLLDNYGIPPVSDRRLRDWIKAGIFPQPVLVTPSRLAFTDEQLDRHAEEKLSLVKQLDGITPSN